MVLVLYLFVKDFPVVSWSQNEYGDFRFLFQRLGADDFLTGKVWPGQLPQTFETEYTESGPPLAPIHICCKLFLLNTLVTRLLKASLLIPASAIKSMIFMDREVFFTQKAAPSLQIVAVHIKAHSPQDYCVFQINGEQRILCLKGSQLPRTGFYLRRL